MSIKCLAVQDRRRGSDLQEASELSRVKEVFSHKLMMSGNPVVNDGGRIWVEIASVQRHGT